MGWMTFRGTHWQRDEGELGARLLAQNLVDKIKLETFFIEMTPGVKRLVAAADALASKAIDKLTAADQALIRKAISAREQLAAKRGKRHQFAVGTGNAGKTEAMLKQAASLKSADATALDSDHKAFNLLNGVLSFVRDENPDSDPEAPSYGPWRVAFTPHDAAGTAINRERLMTKRAEVSYEPAAKCPEFDAFLGITQPKAEMRLFLQVFHAYALLLGGNDEQRLVFHYGTGANGKSAFMEAIGRLAGSYRAVVSPDTITGEQQRDGSKANSDIARLHSTRFVTIEELPRGTPLKENLIKALTGGTRMVARFLQKEIFEFDPVFTAVLSGNDMPNVSGTDYGIWRRLMIVRWGVTIPESDRIPFGQLMARFEGERAGILNWLIEGALLYLNEGLGKFVPPEVLASTEDYRAERDNVGVWAEEFLIPMPGSSVEAGKAYKAYQEWCEANGLRAASQRAFGDRLVTLGFKKKRGGYYLYLDVALKKIGGVTGSGGIDS
jgi:putative DNA primase/helicase